jgi:hypothetical protein
MGGLVSRVAGWGAHCVSPKIIDRETGKEIGEPEVAFELLFFVFNNDPSLLWLQFGLRTSDVVHEHDRCVCGVASRSRFTEKLSSDCFTTIGSDNYGCGRLSCGFTSAGVGNSTAGSMTDLAAPVRLTSSPRCVEIMNMASGQYPIQSAILLYGIKVPCGTLLVAMLTPYYC